MIALLIGAALAAEPTLGAAFEVDVVGPIGVGPRIEATWPLSKGMGGQRLIWSSAAVTTSEFLFLPLALGWRSTGKTTHDVAPVVGAGLQLQVFGFTDHPVVARHAWYGEVGARLTASEGFDLTLVAAPELITFGVPGIGLAVRLGASFAL